MSLTTALEAAMDAARRDADAVSDEVLLSRSLKAVAEKIVERHALEPVRLRHVMIDSPRPTKMAVAGEPGYEEPGGAPLVVRGTAVELFVEVDGAATMALATEGDEDLAHDGVRVDVEHDRVVVRYAAERPLAQVANKHFADSLQRIEALVEAVNAEVAAFDESLPAAVDRELAACRAVAEARRKFAEGLELPGSYERWWGRP
jgi:hypothetical protein